MADVLRWGLLSTAKINKAVIKPIQESSRHKLVAVASRDGEKARAYAAQHHIPKSHGSYEALLADPEVDAIYNPLPNHMHAEWTIKACQAGKHVLCEKPIALTLDEVDAMGAAARKAGVVVQEAFMYRHHPQTLKVKEMLDEGVLGRIRMARGIFTFFMTDTENVRLKPEWGGGALWDVGVYPISYIRSMLGMLPESVFGSQVLGPSGIDISFSGEMVFPNQILAQIQCGFSADYHTTVEFMGEKGSMYISNPFKPYLDSEVLIDRDGSHERIFIKGEDLYLGELEDMAECIFHGKTQRVTIEDSRQNTRVILAMLASAQSGQTVKLK
jgi:D-xylose 1-dehydrogenase (NADP+, D-xylono-1,5-lactone-forming)